jgi:hypothetical protein
MYSIVLQSTGLENVLSSFQFFNIFLKEHFQGCSILKIIITSEYETPFRLLRMNPSPRRRVDQVRDLRIFRAGCVVSGGI